MRRRPFFGSWWRRPATRIVVLASLAATVAVWQAATLLLAPGQVILSGSVLEGRTHVVDGDTLRVADQSIRLHGIDAPERDQTCRDGWAAGAEARRALEDLVAAKPIRCDRVTTDAYRRTVAICRVGGEDVGEALVRRGLAWAYTRFSGRYVDDEERARREGLGIHAHGCVKPAVWRGGHRR